MAYTPPNGNNVNFELRIFYIPDGDMANFNIQTFQPPIWILGSQIQKKLGKSGDEDPWNLRGIYQMRMTKKGKVPIKMRFYRPTDPKTPEQQAGRMKFKDAMLAWQGLTTGQKAVYTERAKPMQMFGHNLFIREFINNS